MIGFKLFPIQKTGMMVDYVFKSLEDPLLMSYLNMKILIEENRITDISNPVYSNEAYLLTKSGEIQQCNLGKN